MGRKLVWLELRGKGQRVGNGVGKVVRIQILKDFEGHDKDFISRVMETLELCRQ